MMAAREWYGSGWDDGCWEYSSASSPVWDDCLPAVWGGHCCAPDAAFSGSFSLESAVHSSILNGWLTAVCVSWHSSLPRRQMCVFRACLCSFDCCVTISTLPPFFSPLVCLPTQQFTFSYSLELSNEISVGAIIFQRHARKKWKENRVSAVRGLQATITCKCTPCIISKCNFVQVI